MVKSENEKLTTMNVVLIIENWILNLPISIRGIRATNDKKFCALRKFQTARSAICRMLRPRAESIALIASRPEALSL